jgi:NADH:ubiquinone reductase (H+-translocating)
MVLHLYYDRPPQPHRRHVRLGISFLGRTRGQMAITSQMIQAKVVTNWMEQHRPRALEAAKRAEETEKAG